MRAADLTLRWLATFFLLAQVGVFGWLGWGFLLIASFVRSFIDIPSVVFLILALASFHAMIPLNADSSPRGWRSFRVLLWSEVALLAVLALVSNVLSSTGD